MPPLLLRTHRLTFALLLAASLAARARAQALQYPQWVTDGPVETAALSGDTLYMGGQFFAVARFTGGGFPASNATALPLAGFPPIRGVVHAVASDGAGGWYVGGEFSEIGGQPRHHLAKLDASFVVTSWAPEPAGPVHALVLSGNTLYAGGAFTQAAGEPRAHAAAFDKLSGTLQPWTPDPDGEVFALARTGNTVVLGGAFSQCGGAARANLAAVSAANGVATGNTFDTDAPVRSLALRGTTLYAGGEFLTASGQPRARLAAWSVGTGALEPFAPALDGTVRALLVSGATLYVGGDLTQVGSTTRRHLAAFDAQSSALLPFDPDFDGAVRALTLQGAALYAGGDFLQAGGEPRLRVAALQPGTGVLLPWDPAVGYPDGLEEVHALEAGGSAVFVGGAFDAIQPVARERLAALVLSSGALTPWAPSVDGLVQHLVLAGDRVIVSGVFAHVQGQPRAGLALLHRTTAQLDAWDPSPDGAVDALVHDGSTLYVGGRFGTLSGQSRPYLGAYSLASGQLLPWAPAPNYHVHALALAGSRLFVGGAFNTIGGAVRNALACIDRSTALATVWSVPGPAGGTDPSVGYVSPRVTALLLNGDRLMVGGVFARWGTADRILTAAFDANSSALLAWAPGGTAANTFRAADLIHDMVLRNDGIAVGGHFTHMGGARHNLATVDAVTGNATAWDPAPDAEVLDLVVQGSSLFVLGSFTGTREAAVPAVAHYVDPSLLDAPGPRPLPAALQLAAPWPNPMRSTSELRYSLPVAGRVRIECYDLNGRLVRTIADGWQAAGAHTAQLARNGLPAGLYWLSVRQAEYAGSRRIVLLP